jgi:holo-[acyl-carrier protein] synthase
VIIGFGVDLVDVSRLEAELQKDGSGFTRELFSPEEIHYCERQRYAAQHYAARFAAKEAVFKALTLAGDEGLHWRDVEVRGEPGGAREIALYGRIKELAEGRGVRRIFVSLSHTRTVAMASVILES